MKISIDIAIGLDPGATTGLGIYLAQEKRLELVMGKTFWEVHSFLKGWLKMNVGEDQVVGFVVEDSRKDNVVFGAMGTYAAVKKRGGHQRAIGAATKQARNVGKVDAHCDLWIDWIETMEYPLQTVAPSSRKKGIDLKLSSDKFNKITKYENKTNEHGRDAAMLVWKRKYLISK